MQRSIGKKILAVVAGVALAAGSAVMGGSTAQAAVENFYWESVWVPFEDRAAVDQQSEAQMFICQSTYQSCYKDYRQDFVKDADGNYASYYQAWVEGGRVVPDDPNTDGGDLAGDAIEAETTPPPPPCWENNNCPVGGAVQAAVPAYMIAGVPQQLVVYSSWRPDANSIAQPTDGTAVLNIDGDDVASAAFVDGVATFSFTPRVAGLKDVKISGVVASRLSGQSAYIDTKEASTMVLPWDPEALEEALKNKKVEVGDTYTLEEVAQAKTALGKRLEWRVAQDSKDVCAVTTTKKGEVRAKFTESGKCSIIWTDPKKDEEGKYTFKVTA